MCFGANALTRVELKPICFIFKGLEEKNKCNQTYGTGFPTPESLKDQREAICLSCDSHWSSQTTWMCIPELRRTRCGYNKCLGIIQ